MYTQRILVLILVILLGVAACAGNTQSETSAPANTASSSENQGLREVTLGLGFVPNVQFAPFYVAQQKGYYADEGLAVELEHGFENDFVTLTAQGERDFAVASGDQVILAQAQGLPVTYVMKWYQRYPVALMLGPEHSVSKLSEVAGKKVGLPGLFGASFIGWKALVHSAGIDETAVDVQEIGFTQAAAVQQGAVDGAMVYIANEPIQLRNQGLNVSVIEVSDYIDLVSNGLVVGDKLMNEEPELVQKVVRATLRGLEETISNPDEAFAMARQIIPEITDEEAPTQRQVLDASISLWRTDTPGISNPDAWRDSVDFMLASGLLTAESNINVDRLFTNKFVEN